MFFRLVGERHINSYFIKNQNPIRFVMGLNVACVLILWLGLEIGTPKSNQQSLEFKITLMWCLSLILIMKYGNISYYYFKI
jgi:hypothetical protein